MPAFFKSCRLRELPLKARRALALFLASLLVAYCALLLATYFHVTPPSSLFLDSRDLKYLLFDSAQPVSQIERLLEATSGPVTGGGSMRPAFTMQSVGWDDAVTNLTGEAVRQLLAEREGERLAVLDWVRSGASRESFENDDYPCRSLGSDCPITPAYRLNAAIGNERSANLRVRIRTLIADRCVTCHHENGRHDTARFIPLASYEQLEPRLRPELPDTRRNWLVAALAALVPLALVFTLCFWHTPHPRRTRWFVAALTFAALAAMLACWFSREPGPLNVTAVLAAAALGALGIAVEATASFSELFSERPDQGSHF